MERVRVVVFGCLVALGLSFCPSVAYASDGFLGGLEDLVGTRKVETELSYEEEYLESYDPSLGYIEPRETGNRDGADEEVEEEASAVDSVNSTVDYMYNVNVFGAGRRTWLSSLQLLLLNSAYLRLMLVVGVGFVFMWWGVRKCIRMVMAAFKKGSASI